MSSVIKVTGPARSVHGVVFNFDDMGQQADQYLTQVQAQAAKILAEANVRAEAIRKQAEEEGRQAALKAVEKILDEKVGKRMETLLPALKKAVDDICHARQDWLNHWEKRAIHTAAAIAGRVVRRQLPQMPEVPAKLVREALEMAAGSSQLRIHLNPADRETLGNQVKRLAEECRLAGPIEVVADTDVSPGGCRLESRHGLIDQTFEAQLARIEEELT